LRALVAVTVAAAATLARPLAIRRMIDFAFGRKRGLDQLVFFASSPSPRFWRSRRTHFVSTLGERIVADLRSDVFKHLCRLDAAFFDTARTSELSVQAHCRHDRDEVRLRFPAAVALRNFLFAGAVAMKVYTSPKLSAAVLIAIPVIVLPLGDSGRLVRRRSRTAQDTLAGASAYAAENLAAVRVMQAFGAEPTTARHFGAAVEEAFAAARNAVRARAGLTIVVIFLVSPSIVGVLWFGARDVLAGRMTGGLLSQFVLYAILAAGALSELSQVWGEISAAGGAAARIAEILALRPAIVAPVPATALPCRAGRNRLRTCDFASGKTQDSALHGLVQVAPGETVAIIGPSGAGKTTCSSSSRGFTIPPQAESCLMASTSRALIRRSCGGESRVFRKTR
jgi:ATP-binding cassette subfamily B protein